MFDRDPISSLAFQFRNVKWKRICQTNFSAFDQDHDARGSCDDFREAREIENCIDRHCLTGRLDGPIAVSLPPNNLTFAAHENNRARQFLLSDRFRNDTVNLCQSNSRDLAQRRLRNERAQQPNRKNPCDPFHQRLICIPVPRG